MPPVCQRPAASSTHQIVEAGGWCAGDAGEHVREPSLRVDVVELRGGDQAVDKGGPFAAAVGAGEEPRLPTEGDAAQRALGGVVREADTAVGEEGGEAAPALQHVVHRPGDRGMAREPGPLAVHPGFEVGDQRRDLRLPDGETCVGVVAVDRALGVEDGVDAGDGLAGERRDRRRLGTAAGGGGDVGELEELAPGMRPAECLRHRDWSPVRRVERPEAGIGVGLEDAAPSGEMRRGMLAAPVS
jgi:hypothetical protein